MSQDASKLLIGILLLIAFFFGVVEYTYWLYNGDDVPPQVEQIIKF